MEEKNIISKIFMWFCLGLLITFMSGYYLSTNVSLLTIIFGNSFVFWGILILELVIAFYLPLRLNKMNKNTAIALYVLYTLLTGISFASIFIVFTLWSIVYVFLATSIIFLIFALIGKYTKLDLTKFGTFLLMGLIGVLVLEIINIFLANSQLDMILCIIGLVIFIGFVAYDIQKIKRFIESSYLESDKLAIIGAFDLYLDFINIFLKLLRLFGKSRD